MAFTYISHLPIQQLLFSFSLCLPLALSVCLLLLLTLTGFGLEMLLSITSNKLSTECEKNVSNALQTIGANLRQWSRSNAVGLLAACKQ